MEGYDNVTLAQVRTQLKEERYYMKVDGYSESSCHIEYADGHVVSWAFDEFVDPSEISLQNIVHFVGVWDSDAWEYSRMVA